MSRIFLVFVLAIIIAIVGAQVEHGSINGPSGRFEKTKNQASPPADLSLRPIFLPEATPIHEAPQEFEARGLYRR